MYWILLARNAYKEAATEGTVVTTKDSSSVYDTENVQDAQEDDNYGVFVWAEIQDTSFFGDLHNEEGTMDFSHQFYT